MPRTASKAPKVDQRLTEVPLKRGQNKLAVKQRRARFIEAYLSNGQNITQAAIAAGYSPKSAATQGSEIRKNPQVAAEIARREAEALQKVKLTTDDYYRSLRQTLDFDPRKLYRSDGTLKDVTELDDDTAAAMAGMDVQETAGPNGTKIITRKLRWHDKNAARDQLGKALRIYGEAQTNVNIDFGDALRAARERVAMAERVLDAPPALGHGPG